MKHSRLFSQTKRKTKHTTLTFVYRYYLTQIHLHLLVISITIWWFTGGGGVPLWFHTGNWCPPLLLRIYKWKGAPLPLTFNARNCDLPFSFHRNCLRNHRRCRNLLENPLLFGNKTWKTVLITQEGVSLTQNGYCHECRHGRGVKWQTQRALLFNTIEYTKWWLVTCPKNLDRIFG